MSKPKSVFEGYVIQVLKCIVPDQKMSLIDSASGVYTSVCKQVNNYAITTIDHNDFTIAIIYYNYDTSEEQIIYL